MRIALFLIALIAFSSCGSDFNTPLDNPPIAYVSGPTYHGYSYKAVKIGQQTWLSENLKTRLYANGDEIPYGHTAEAWKTSKRGMRCAYEHDEANERSYGYLYNWYVVIDERGVCPSGWHVPSDKDWLQLETFLGVPSDQVESKGGRDSGLPQVKLGTKLKAKNGWLDRGSGTDEYGFSAVPAGFRWSNWSQVQDDWDTSPTFFYEGENAFFWTSTSSGLKEMEHEGETVVMESAWYRDIHHRYPAIYRNDCPKNHGNSIRCIRDAE